MKPDVRHFSLVAAACVAVFGCNRPTEPRNYDECILKSMEGVSSNYAAAEIKRVCRRKFPAPEVEVSELPAENRHALKGRAAIREDGYFGGNIYNGDSEWTITQVTIKLTPKNPDGSEGAKDDGARSYNVDVSIPPLSTATFSFFVGDVKQYAWKIASARGHL
jgi:hypothetical protein